MGVCAYNPQALLWAGLISSMEIWECISPVTGGLGTGTCQH